MTTLNDINSERDAALAILNQKLVAANNLKNTGATGMDSVINALAAQRANVATQAYARALNEPTMAQALAVLQAATMQMNTAAARMVSAATFITNLVSLGTATNSVISALKGGSQSRVDNGLLIGGHHQLDGS